MPDQLLRTYVLADTGGHVIVTTTTTTTTSDQQAGNMKPTPIHNALGRLILVVLSCMHLYIHRIAFMRIEMMLTPPLPYTHAHTYDAVSLLFLPTAPIAS